MTQRLPIFIDQKRRYSLILSEIPAPPARILEVGVGGGWLVRHLQELGYQVAGCDVDLSNFQGEEAERLGLRKANPDGTLAFESNEFDVVVSCDVLEHVQPAARERFIEELFRVTKNNGKVVVTAFFCNTRGFALWGAFMLLFTRALPSWFLEHLTIPLPREEDVKLMFLRHCADVRLVRYQRFLNTFISALQIFPDRLGFIRRLGGGLSRALWRWDVLGEPTSTMFVGCKEMQVEDGRRSESQRAASAIDG